MDKIIYLAVIVIFVFLSFKFEELIYWAVDNIPWIVIGFLIISGIFIAFTTIKNLISSYKQDPVKTIKYIIKLGKSKKEGSDFYENKNYRTRTKDNRSNKRLC